MCILLKSPVRSCTVTSVTRPTSLSGVSVGVSPSSCLLNISGARRLYHTFAFHLSLILRAAARDFFSAMRAARRGGAYLRVAGRHPRNTEPGRRGGRGGRPRCRSNAVPDEPEARPRETKGRYRGAASTRRATCRLQCNVF